MAKHRILVLFDTAGPPPADQDFSRELATKDWKAERDVIETLKEAGHKIDTLGIYDDLAPLTERLSRNRPDIVFNLTEHFAGHASFDRHIAGLFELMKVPYTGAAPGALFLAKNKGLAKAVLAHHGLLTPSFAVLHRDEPLKMPRYLRFPVLVKPLREEASYGITQKALVSDIRAMKKRVEYVFHEMKDDVILEEYIEGREIYAGVLGNRKTRVFPLREMVFAKKSQPAFATFKAKWDKAYRRQWGITNRFAIGFSRKTQAQIIDVVRKATQILYLRGYARLDLRVTADNRVYIIEANPNPHIAKDEDFALSAKKAGVGYETLLGKIISLGFSEHKKVFG